MFAAGKCVAATVSPLPHPAGGYPRCKHMSTKVSRQEP